MAIQFRCYSCRALLRLANARPGLLVGCGRCGELMELQPPPADAPLSSDRLQTWRSLPAAPGSAGPPNPDDARYWHQAAGEALAPRRPAPPPRVTRMPTRDPMAMAFDDAAAGVRDDYVPPPPRVPYRAPRRSRGWEGLKTALAIASAALVLLCCGGIVAVWRFNPFTASTTLTSGRYKATAPGWPVKTKSSGGASSASRSWRTGSVFELGIYREATASDASLDEYMQSVRFRGGADVRRVQRGELIGMHYRLPVGQSMPQHEAEVFPLPEGLLLMIYINGSDIADREGKPRRRTAQESREIDDPDAFFASLETVEP